MIDQELLIACVINSWSVTPRMMLVDSMIESGYEEFKAMESFEPPTVSNYLPLTYNVNSGYGSGRGCGYGYGDGLGSGYGYGDGLGSNGFGRGRGRGSGDGIGFGHGIGDHGNGMILE